MFASTPSRGLLVVLTLALIISIPVALPAAHIYGSLWEEKLDDVARTADGESLTLRQDNFTRL